MDEGQATLGPAGRSLAQTLAGFSPLCVVNLVRCSALCLYASVWVQQGEATQNFVSAVGELSKTIDRHSPHPLHHQQSPGLSGTSRLIPISYSQHRGSLGLRVSLSPTQTLSACSWSPGPDPCQRHFRYP